MTLALERDSALPIALEVRRDPSGEDYLETRKYKVGQSVAMLEFADVPLEWWV